MKGDKVLDLSQALKDILKQKDWQKTNACLTINGTCKLSLYIREREYESEEEEEEEEEEDDEKLQSCAKILEITSQGELLNEKDIIPQNRESIECENILLNFAGEELFVQSIRDADQSKKSVMFYPKS